MQGNTQVDLRGLILVIIVGAWLAGIVLGSFLLLPSSLLLLGTGFALICLIPFWHSQPGRLVLILLCCLLLGAWRYTISAPGKDPQAISTFIGNHVLAVRGSVSDEPTTSGRSRTLVVTVNSISGNGGLSWRDAHGEIEVQTLGTTIENPYGANYGDSVELQGKLQSPPPHSSASIFASMAFPRLQVTSRDGNPVISFLYHLRVTLATILAQALPQPQAALMVAILLGLRTPPLSPQSALALAFNVTGTVHLIVPSGFKVTILAGLVASSMRWLTHQHRPQDMLPAQRRRNWRMWLATTIVLISIASYTILSGAGPAAIRAGIMGALIVIAPRLDRVYNVYTALALTAFIMSAVDPFVIWSVGFLLSFLGTLGIILLTPHFQRLLHPIARLPLGHHIREIIAVTLAAQTATLPIFATTFQEISFIAPIANMLTVPLLGLLILSGLLICGAGLILMPLAVVCGWVAWPILWYVTNSILWCANLPGAYISVNNIDSRLAWGYYGVLLLITLWIVKKNPSVSNTVTAHQRHTLLPGISPRTWRIARLSAAALVIVTTGAMATGARAQAQLTITFLAVGPAGQPAQGEAILVRTQDGKTVLVDGGLDIASLSQALDSHLPPWQHSLDALLLTTPERDHITGLQDIVSRYQVGEVIDGGMLHPNATYALWRRTITEHHLRYVLVSHGTTITIGAQLAFQVLWPAASLHKGSNENRDNTLVMRLLMPGLHILLVGAAAQSTYALAGLLAQKNTNYLQAEIVQIVGETNKPVPPELGELLQMVHPALLVVTPAALSPQQRKLTQVSTIVPATLLEGSGANWQILQTAQVGTAEISSSHGSWNLNTM